MAGPEQVIYADWIKPNRYAAQVLRGEVFSILPQTVLASAGANQILRQFRITKRGWTQLHAILKVSATASDAADTLDMYLDCSPDGGKTWMNLVHFTRMTGTTSTPRVYVAVTNAHDTLGAHLDVSADLGDSAVPARPLMGRDMRVRASLVDTVNPGDTSFTVTMEGMLS